jgi:ABC-2 type transport system permease protein
VTDWPSVGLLAAVAAAFFAVGLIAFERRDIGDSTALRWLRLPSLPAGIGGPFRRQLADRTGIAIAWGVGVGLYAALIVASAEAFATSITTIPQIAELIKSVYPGVDITQPSGILQLTFFGFGSFVIGLAAASFVGAWSSDETGGRLAVVMSAPISRVRWMLSSGFGVMAAIGVMALVLGAILAAAVMTQGGDLAGPLGGVAVLALASAAFAGVGFAVGGVVRASLAAPVVAMLVIATFLLDTLGAALDLPDGILQLSLYKHVGQPMAGVFDPVGIVAGAVLAIGGLLIGAWGLRRRDLDR